MLRNTYIGYLVQRLEQKLTENTQTDKTDSHSVLLPAKSFFLFRTTIPDGLGKDAMCQSKWFGHKLQLEAYIMPTRQYGRPASLFTTCNTPKASLQNPSL
jgi:hypothetical protein